MKESWVEELPLNLLNLSQDIQRRVKLDVKWAMELLETYKATGSLEPIQAVYDGVEYWVWDGFHRCHAYEVGGVATPLVRITRGSKEEAIILSFTANDKHGLPYNREDKAKRVLDAKLVWPNMSNRELSKKLGVSHTYIASILSPTAKERQQEIKEKSKEKKINELVNEKISEAKQIIDDISVKAHEGEAPDDEEIRASELAQQADIEAMIKLLDSDDKLNDAYKEIKRLNALVASLDGRMRSLKAEKDQAIKAAKAYQKENDKLKEQIKSLTK